MLPSPVDGILSDLIFPPACHCEHRPTPVLGAPHQPPTMGAAGRSENGGSCLPLTLTLHGPFLSSRGSGVLERFSKGLLDEQTNEAGRQESMTPHRSVQFIKSSVEAASNLYFFFFFNPNPLVLIMEWL